MANPVEFWTFMFANGGLIALSVVLAGLSLLAYRRAQEGSTYAIATIGFVSMGLAGLSESVYALLVQPDYVLTARQFLLLQAGDDLLTALGLGLLFYAITRHKSGSSRVEETTAWEEEGDQWVTGGLSDD